MQSSTVDGGNVQNWQKSVEQLLSSLQTNNSKYPNLEPKLYFIIILYILFSIKSLDDGTFILGPKHEKLDPPSFDEEFSAFIVNESKIYIKSGFGKYLKVDTNGMVVGRSDAGGQLEIFEPIWDDGKMALQAANSCFLSVDPEDDQLVAIKKSIGSDSDGVCVIRSNAYRGEIISKNAPIEEKIEDLDQIELNYVKKFQKFQDKKIKINQVSNSEVKNAQKVGKLHESLLDRRAAMKADRYCK